MKERAARDFKELLRAGLWFRGLADDFQDALLAAATLRRYTPGAKLVPEATRTAEEMPSS